MIIVNSTCNSYHHHVVFVSDATCDRVLGFTSVDLGPLLAGIRSLDGWYNIMDFSGQTLGQIKVSHSHFCSLISTSEIQFCQTVSLVVRFAVGTFLYLCTPQKKFCNSSLIYYISLYFLFSALKLVS